MQKLHLSKKIFLFGALVLSSFSLAKNFSPKTELNNHIQSNNFNDLKKYDGCLEASEGQYPNALLTAECIGKPYVFVGGILAGQYSLVILEANVTYKFTSSVISDYLTIGNENGNTVLATGSRSASYTPSKDEIVRVYIHSDEYCGSNEEERGLFLECGENVTITAPDFSCYYGDGFNSNNLEGFFPAETALSIANSVTLTQGLKVKEFRFNFASYSEIFDIKVNLWSDNNGTPGEILHTLDPANFITRLINVTPSGYRTYELSFKVVNPFDLAAGKYWVQPITTNDGNPNAAWETTSTGTSNSSYKISFNGGTNWEDAWDTNTAVFFISGDCLDLNTTDFSSEKSNIYPNPVTNILNISNSKTIDKIVILDVSGRKILGKVVNSKNTQINVSSLNAGVYIVQTTIGNSIETSKIVKK